MNPHPEDHPMPYKYFGKLKRKINNIASTITIDGITELDPWELVETVDKLYPGWHLVIDSVQDVKMS